MAWASKPIALFVVAALAIAGIAVAATAMQVAVRRSDHVATQAALDLGTVERLRGLRERVSRKVRTFMVTGDERFLVELGQAERDFGALLSNVRAASRSHSEVALVDRLEKDERMRKTVTERLVAARKAGASVEALARPIDAELQPILDTLDRTLVELVGFHQQEVERARERSEITVSRAALGLWVAAAVALVIAGLTSRALARTLERVEARAGRLERERDRFFDLSIDLVCIAGTDGYFKQLNPAFEVVFGYTREELLGKPFIEFVHPDDREATLKQVEGLSAGRPSIDFENRYACKDGSYRWLSWHASPEPGGAIYAVARDITERRAQQEKLAALTEELRVMAVVDELTGLHNRRGFHLLAEQHLKHAQRSRKKATFFFADLDGLKQINDQLGHEVGDRALREAASVLAAAFRKSDIVARLGGDEFVVLATDADDGQVQPLLDRVQELVRRFNCTKPLPPFSLAVSIGSTVYDPEQPESLDTVLKRADQMMYEQKVRRKAAALVH